MHAASSGELSTAGAAARISASIRACAWGPAPPASRGGGWQPKQREPSSTTAHARTRRATLSRSPAQFGSPGGASLPTATPPRRVAARPRLTCRARRHGACPLDLPSSGRWDPPVPVTWMRRAAAAARGSFQLPVLPFGDGPVASNDPTRQRGRGGVTPPPACPRSDRDPPRRHELSAGCLLPLPLCTATGSLSHSVPTRSLT